MNQSGTSRLRAAGIGMTGWVNHRILGFTLYTLVLSSVFLLPSWNMVRHAVHGELHSHAILIPLVSLYLAVLKRHRLPVIHGEVPLVMVCCAGVAVAWWFGGTLLGMSGWSSNDRLAWGCVCFLLLLTAGGFLFLGASWMRCLWFPFALLVFLVPLPDGLAVALESVLMRSSAWLAHAMLQWTDTPVLRSGQVIELPGIALEVARECSGIRSSLVLFITSLIAAHLFLSSPWHRGLLVALVFPLGILRNAIRVVAIGLLCVHRGPEMIDSWIHHHGGPVFFVLSLMPLFLVAVLLRGREASTMKFESRMKGTTIP